MHFRYNVGPIIPMMVEDWKRGVLELLRLRKPEKQKWSDAKWVRILKTIIDRRTVAGIPSFTVRVGTLCNEIRSLKACQGENVLWQVQQTFQARSADFLPGLPTGISPSPP